MLQIRMGLAVLASEDRDGWTGRSLSEWVAEMLESRERFDAELLRLVGSWDRDRAWEIDGALSLGRGSPTAPLLLMVRRNGWSKMPISSTGTTLCLWRWLRGK